MAWDTSAKDLAAILSRRSVELSQRLGGRAGTFKEQSGPIACIHMTCEDVQVSCYINRTGDLEWDIEFPCEQFGTDQNDVCKTSTYVLFEVLKYGFKLEQPSATPLTRKNGVIVDALDVQFTVLFEELDFLAAHLLFDPHRRDLAAAYIQGYSSGYTYVYSGHGSD